MYIYIYTYVRYICVCFWNIQLTKRPCWCHATGAVLPNQWGVHSLRHLGPGHRQGRCEGRCAEGPGAGLQRQQGHLEDLRQRGAFTWKTWVKVFQDEVDRSLNMI